MLVPLAVVAEGEGVVEARGVGEAVTVGVGVMVVVRLGVALLRQAAPGSTMVTRFTCARQPGKTDSAATAIFVCEPSVLVASRTKVCVLRG